MKKFLKICFVYYKVKLQEVLSYRVVIISWSLVAAIPLLVASSIWLNSQSLYDTFGGFTRNQMITYYVLFFFLSQIFSSYAFFSIMNAIINGNLSFFLLKPFSFFAVKTLDEISWRTIDVLIRLPIFIAVIIFSRNFLELKTGLFSWIAFFLAVFLGAAITQLAAMIFGILAFWFTHIESFHSLYFIFFVLLSGEAVPLHLYPSKISAYIKLLPFRYIFSFPTEIILGSVTREDLFLGFIMSLFWFLFLSYLWNTLWKKGLAVYSAYGG